MIKNNLLKLMRNAGLTEEKLSEETKISRNTIHLMKHNKSNGIDYKTLNTLCKYLNCGVGDILKYEEEK